MPSLFRSAQVLPPGKLQMYSIIAITVTDTQLKGGSKCSPPMWQMPSLFRSAQVLPPAAWPHRCLLQEARVHRAGHAAGAPDRWYPHPFPHPGALHHQRHPPGHPHHHLRLFTSTWGRCADHLWRSMWVHTLWFCPLCGWVMLFVLAWERFCQLISSEKVRAWLIN